MRAWAGGVGGLGERCCGRLGPEEHAPDNALVAFRREARERVDRVVGARHGAQRRAMQVELRRGPPDTELAAKGVRARIELALGARLRVRACAQLVSRTNGLTVGARVFRHPHCAHQGAKLATQAS